MRRHLGCPGSSRPLSGPMPERPWPKARSLTRATASMPASGLFLTILYRGGYATNCVYDGVTGWHAFEPALTRAEEMDSGGIWQCATEIPEEWYEGDRDDLNHDELLTQQPCAFRQSQLWNYE